MRPLVWRAISPRSTSLERLVPRVDAAGCRTPLDVGRRDEDLAVEAPGRSSAGSSFSSRLEAAMTTTSSLVLEAVHLDQELVEGLVLLAGDVVAALAADGVELVDEDDRRRVLARLAEQPPDARRAQAGEHLHEGGRRLGEEVRARLVRDRLGEQRLARAGRPVQQDPLGHPGSERRKRSGVAQELDDLASSCLASSAPAMSSQPLELGAGLICCGLVRASNFSVRQRKKTSSAMKRTGGHVSDPRLELVVGKGEREDHDCLIGRSGRFTQLSTASSWARTAGRPLPAGSAVHHDDVGREVVFAADQARSRRRRRRPGRPAPRTRRSARR